jgi:hypothetical protein
MKSIRWALVATALMACGVRDGAGQEGAYLTYGTYGPEAGVILRLGSRLSVEPGLFLSYNRYKDDEDSSSFWNRNIAAGLVAQLRWMGAADAVVSPVAGLSVGVGRQWVRSKSEYLYGAFAAVSQTRETQMLYLAAVQAGLEVRFSEWVSLSFEYDFGVRHFRGDFERKSSTVPGFTVTVRGDSRTTVVGNGFNWTVRVYPGRRGRGAEVEAGQAGG